ncbi:CocE/NonD family hydrolase [bacterium]|nr:CocE/NonD family hydrolase [bacterium]
MAATGCASHGGPDLDRAWWDTSGDEKSADQDRAERGVVYANTYLTMRDGVRIAVDYYLPEDRRSDEKLPTIFLQTRYWRRPDLRGWVTLFVDETPEELERIIGAGYAIVRVDARGSGASEGFRRMPWSPDEIADGAEVVDWIIAQPWSDGTVGAVGGSYEGTAAEFLMLNHHPAVKAVAPMFSLYDVYTDIAFPGGAQLSGFTEPWQALNAALDRNKPGELIWWIPLLVHGVKPVDADEDEIILEKAIADHARNYHVHDEAKLVIYRDDPMGEKTIAQFSPHAYADEMRREMPPVYSYSGWYDGAYGHAAIKRYLTNGDTRSRLTLGPWDHGGDDQMRPFAKAAPTDFDHVGEMLRFFDHYVKGEDTGIEPEPPVHYYTMVEDRWHAAAAWPPPATETSFYLATDEMLRTAPSSANVVEYDVNPTATTGDEARWDCLVDDVSVTYPKRRLLDRRLAVFDSEPLATDMEVTGHPIVDLVISADTEDAQVFVYLEDVRPDGEVGFVTEGVLRALHRRLSTDEPPYKTPAPYHTFLRADGELLTPGQPARLRFDLQPTSYLFQAGHRVRVAVGTRDAGHFATLPNEPTRLSIHVGGESASRIELPVVAR